MNHPPHLPDDASRAPAQQQQHQQQQQPQKLLVPTKVNQFAASGHGSQNNNNNMTHYEAFPRGQASRWTAQPVMEWIESLAAATEANDRRGPMLVGGTTLLSQPSPPLPPGALLSPPVAAAAVQPPISEQEQHRDDAKPRLWDLSYVDQYDPLAWNYTRQIDRLAVQLEELAGQSKSPTQVPTAKIDSMMAAYRALQTRVEFTFGRILGQAQQQQQQSIGCPPTTGSSKEYHPSTGTYSITTDGETRTLLDALYQETIQKLQSLIADHSPNGDKPRGPSKKLPSVLATTKTTQATKPPSKQEFAAFMTQWLRANWTNPYPDDQGLAEMAAHCGTTVQVISNWLINARTRKWRPAIIKATELGRPSDLLLEDSINLFEGKPVREIHLEDYQQQQQQQQQPPQHLKEEDEFDIDDQDALEFNEEGDDEEEEQSLRKRFRSAY